MGVERRSIGGTQRALRDALGRFATGVTVVTAWSSEGEPKGFTASSFTSVSLDPPLVLVCVALRSSNIRTFSTARAFTVNVLRAGQADVSRIFASPSPDRFRDVPWRRAAAAPVLDDTLAWFDCRTERAMQAGDHVVLLGGVADFGSRDGSPLIWFGGDYADLSRQAQPEG